MQEGAEGTLAQADAAKTDMQGGRQGGATTQQKRKNGEEDSSLKIRIELDIDVEVHLTARVKGDITIGLL